LLTHLGDRTLLAVYAAGFCMFFSFLGLFTYLPFRLVQPPFEFGPGLIGIVYLVYAPGIVASPLAGRLGNLISRRLLLVAALGLTALANVLTLTSLPLVLLVALLFLSFNNFLAQSTATSLVARGAASGRAGANSMYLFAYYLGGSLGGLIPGLLWQGLGWNGVVAATSGALVVATLVVALGVSRA
jgi:YNFM family putative membrane transporter